MFYKSFLKYFIINLVQSRVFPIKNMLKFQNLSVNYSDGTKALIDFNLEVQEAEIVALVGESGSGKSTAIRTAMGLLPSGGQITNGYVYFQDLALNNLNEKQWHSLRGKKMSIIFQDSGAMLNPIRTIGSQFVEYIKRHSKSSKAEALNAAKEMLEQMGLYDGDVILKSIPSQLSGGMRQRVGIAFAMMFRPAYLLADEPTSALDVTIQSQIVKQMMELRDKFNTSILIVTHNIAVAAYMADKILVMRKGKVIERGSPKELINNPQDDYTKELLTAIPDIYKEPYV